MRDVFDDEYQQHQRFSAIMRSISATIGWELEYKSPDDKSKQSN